jgi:methyl-accepting chemotaxis protein
MKSFLYKLVGIALILASIVGLIFSISVTVIMWQYKDVAVESISNSIDLINTALDATAEGLEVSQQALETSVKSIQALSGTVKATAQTIEATGPMLDSLSTLLNKDIPTTISATQSSLTAVAESAKILDGFLGLITSLPLINRYEYNPDVPLYTALIEVSESLNGLPDALSEMESGLKSSSDNVQVINAELQLMVDNINEIEESVEGFSNVVTQLDGDCSAWIIYPGVGTSSSEWKQ